LFSFDVLANSVAVSAYVYQRGVPLLPVAMTRNVTRISGGRVVLGSGRMREKGVMVHKEPDRHHHENQDAVHVASIVTRSAAKRARWPSLLSGKP